MTSATSGVVVEQSVTVMLDELAHDLQATWDLSRSPQEVSGWMSRPGILRRISSAISPRLTGEIDRIVATGTGAQTLGAALALETGLPFCAVVGEELFGVVHDGESVAIVSAVSPRLGPEYSWHPPVSVAVKVTIEVVADEGEILTGATECLFVVGSGGKLSISERTST